MAYMRYRLVKNFSLSVSVAFHLLLFASFLIFNFNSDNTPQQYYEITFGNGEGTGSSGGSGTEMNANIVQPKDLIKPVENNKDIKGVDLQKSEDKTNKEVTETIGRKRILPIRMLNLKILPLA